MEASTQSLDQTIKQDQEGKLTRFFFGNKPLEMQMIAFIGPFFLFISLLLVRDGNIPFFIGIALCAIICTCFGFKWGAKAIYCAFIPYSVLFFLACSDLLFVETLWLFGSFCSIILAQLITILAFQESVAVVSSMQSNNSEAEQQLISLEEKIKASEDNVQKELGLLAIELEKWKDEAELRLVERNKTNELLDLASQEIHFLSGNKEKLINDAVTARKQAFEALQLNEDLKQKLLAVAAPAIPIDTINDADISIPNNPIESLYKQLRVQFEEKCQVLNEARVALFNTEGKLHIAETIKEQEQIVANYDDCDSLQVIIADLTLENESLQKEIEELEKIIDSTIIQ